MNVLPGLTERIKLALTTVQYTAGENITTKAWFYDRFNNTIPCKEHDVVGTLAMLDNPYFVTVESNTDCVVNFIQITRAGLYILIVNRSTMVHEVCCVNVSPAAMSTYRTNIYGSGLGLASEQSHDVGFVYAGLNYSIFVHLKDAWGNYINDTISLNQGTLINRIV